ncbi:hypothetical protein FQN55_005604 [Onygenales sp. PD_40]|nr:hypothetical protein FQN55_005604 [Onygenales sp. PD_40]KAK2773274.1 hypothetical protein FQN53_004185 [Emmonsiellopsis sp. PD_33]KAK2778372.1 hypothetical protein FQN52_002745 [Onygenales sp. PD_12]KAK2795953.1 hypothetical protein FQN51_009611 [Onygenales sp. PD_10]
MAKPTLIFTPGAWHSPECFGAVISKLEPLGYKCIGVSLKAVGHEPPVQTLQPDIDGLNAAVLDELQQGNDVMVVPHSWSGTVVTGALEGLGKADRERAGEKNGVVKLAYIAAFMPFEGVSLSQAMGGKPPEWWDEQGLWLLPKTPEKILYNDLPDETAEFWVSKLQPHSHATNFVGVPTASWRKIPSSYLLCENDQAIPLFVQEAMVKACQDAGATIDTTKIAASHSPFLSKPDEVVEFLRRAAGEAF